MQLHEVFGDLFTAPADYYLCHCVSSDFVLGKGIALMFQIKFGTRDALRAQYPMTMSYVGRCLPTGHVLNLVTKELYWHKPTYDSLQASLIDMLRVCSLNGINKIAMPRIGCGLDRLCWPIVRNMLLDVFGRTAIEIAVYSIDI